MTHFTQGNNGWLFTPDFAKNLTVEDEQSFFESPTAFKAILESIQDGVSVIDNSLNIKYMNATLRHLYENRKNCLGKKCYSIFHSRKKPCSDCPCIKAMVEKKPVTSIVRYLRDNDESNFHQLFAIPVLNTQGDVILVVEYIRDITFQKNISENLNDLAQRFEALEEQNRILGELLRQKTRYRDALEHTISTNVERFVKPSLEYLKKTARKEDIELVNGLIDEIVYPITKKRPNAVSTLTPRELQVALFVKDGLSSKEVAEKLCVTKKAVDYHRLNIRKKLNLPRKTSLRTYLEFNL